MKKVAAAIGVVWLCSLVSAQSRSASSLSAAIHKGAWDLNAFVSGGKGLGERAAYKFFYAGGHVGRILTPDYGKGWYRGNFEWAGDFTPIYVVFQPQYAAKGGSFAPVIWRWNFISGKRMAPYTQASGGVLFTTRDVPPFTSNVNFITAGGFGIHLFAGDRQAVAAEVSVAHISNASLGDRNPGLNGSIHFRLGYTWFK